jgi:hypothetical protein
VLGAGCAAVVLAAICGLVLAPGFESRVIEKSPTDPSKLRPPESIYVRRSRSALGSHASSSSMVADLYYVMVL